jgi:hypothetical protein
MYGNLRLRAVVYRGQSAWVARTLEHDIAAFADHVDDLPGKLRKAIAANLLINARHGREGLEGIPPAPAQFIEMYERAKLDVTPRDPGVVGAVETDLRLVEMA